MKQSITIVLLVISLSSFCQKGDDLWNKFSIGLNYTPNYCFRTLHSSKADQPIIDARKVEKPAYGFNSGISIGYDLLDHLSISTGIQYSQQTFQFKNINAENIQGEKLGKADGKYFFDYIEIPVNANYTFSQKRLSYYMIGGLSINLFLSDKFKSKIEFSDGHTEEHTGETKWGDFNRPIYATVLGFGCKYNINQKFNVRFEPIFRYSLQPILDAKIEQHQYSIGGQFGIYMNIEELKT
ncbi:MAG: porin family protein [Bacteroidales bacterium]|nr:porin family protein [Bacteroidales bacterium]MCF8457043.1 porin family protein [Bacteroidales bacterium]